MWDPKFSATEWKFTFKKKSLWHRSGSNSRPPARLGSKVWRLNHSPIAPWHRSWLQEIDLIVIGYNYVYYQTTDLGKQGTILQKSLHFFRGISSMAEMFFVGFLSKRTLANYYCVCFCWLHTKDTVPHTVQIKISEIQMIDWFGSMYQKIPSV